MKRWEMDGAAKFLNQAFWLCCAFGYGALWSHQYSGATAPAVFVSALALWGLRLWRTRAVAKGAKLRGGGWEIEEVFSDAEKWRRHGKALQHACDNYERLLREWKPPARNAP